MADSTTWIPSDKDLKTLRMVFEDFEDCKKAREKKYRLLGDRTPQNYWDECEKRFVSYVPAKDVTEQDWQANLVMGITRNAVLKQVANAGGRVPEVRHQTFTKDGFYDDMRTKINQNLYRWSLRREHADQLQQYTSLGNYVRGNACIYEGFEDDTQEVEIITDTDQETGEVKTKTQEVRKWGPKRQIVPVDELYFKNYFLNDVQEQPVLIWRQILSKEAAKAQFGGMKNFEYVKFGAYTITSSEETFFRSTAQLTGKQCEVLRVYYPIRGSGHKRDRHILVVGGVILLDIPLPFNHKKYPFAWCKNEPFSDMFMLGMSIPFKVMQEQDTADGLLNMGLDREQLALLSPTITDDPDPNVRTYLSPGDIIQVAKGAMYQPYPLQGTPGSSFNMLQQIMSLAQANAGGGGASAATPRGGKVQARQAVMMEEEAKRLLGISMTNLEGLERDLFVLRMPNIYQFAPGSDMTVDVQEADLSTGGKGRFVATFAKNAGAAEKMKPDLDMVEEIGEMLNQPTEAVAIKPNWFDFADRMEAEAVPESTYLKNKSIEQAQEMEDNMAYAKIPQFADQLNWSEMLKKSLKIRGLDEKKMIKPPAPPPGPMGTPGQPGQQGQGGQPFQPGAGGGEQTTGMVTNQLAGSSQAKSIDALMGG